MLNIWTQSSGYTFPGVSGLTGNLVLDSAKTDFDGGTTSFDKGSFQERVVTNIHLPVANTLPTDSFKLISGSLPDGLRIEGQYIVGVPYGSVRNTVYTFCVRAQRGNEIADRTFNLQLSGGQLPIIKTSPGLLSVGRYGQPYAVGYSKVDFQLEAIDPDGGALKYFIAAGDGRLPPGLTLSLDGKITGITKPVPSVEISSVGSGSYDESFYDSAFYDFGLRSSNGYDSFIFDTTDFDYSAPTRVPKSVNQTYEFLVSVSTGDVIVKRKFAIFVIGEDSFTADYTEITDDSLIFTADATVLKQPLWLTNSNLGVTRADNYVTFILETLDIPDSYPITYTIDSISNLPPGLTFNPVGNNVYIAGRIPFMPSIAKTYTFKITASRTNNTEPPVSSSRTFTLRVIGDIDNQITWVSPKNIGTISANFISELEVTATSSTNTELIYSLSSGSLPPGLSLTSDGTISGKVNQYGVANIARVTTIDGGLFTLDQDYGSLWPRLEIYGKTSTTGTGPFLVTFSIPTKESLAYNGGRNEFFKVVNNSNPAYNGTFQCTASTTTTIELSYATNPGSFGTENVTLLHFPNSLPPPSIGTTVDGSHQYDIIGKRGLILFDADTPGFTIDGGNTTFDRSYTFTAKAEDQYGFAKSEKQFIISVVTPNNKLFSNIKTQPLLSLPQRASFKKFITSADVFTSTSIYRPSDPNFGIRKDLAMLIYAGIESVEAAAFLGAMGLNNKRKRFHFGSIKKAVANKSGSPLYEVVYIEMIDPMEVDGKAPGKFIKNNARDTIPVTVDSSNAIWTDPSNIATMELAESWLDRPINTITVDSTAYDISDSAPNKHYINSVTNWRNNLYEVGDTERNFLPQWMRSIQPGQKQQLGFKLAVPLCYCLPGKADDIILNIKYSGFDFKSLDYTIDRYIIDSVEGYSSDKYLVFKNHSTTV